MPERATPVCCGEAFVQVNRHDLRTVQVGEALHSSDNPLKGVSGVLGGLVKFLSADCGECIKKCS